MAKQPRVAGETEPASEPYTEMVTYTPGPLDPVTAKWCGHVFHANVAKEIKAHADGAERDKLNHHLVERARENKFFLVGTAKDGTAKAKRDPQAMPTTAREYVGYMVEWLKDDSIQNAEQLISRFARDRDLRATCDVGTDDYNYLATLFMPKLHELQRMDELSDAQIGSLWVSHGINQLPWSA